MIHSLKTEKDSFEAVTEFKKKCEVRINDRNYQVGDYIALNELNENGIGYTGRSVLLQVTHIVDDARFCKEDYVVMSFQPVRVIKEPHIQPEFIQEGESR